MFLCTRSNKKVDDPEYLKASFYGAHRKSLTQDFVCFQQAAVAYLQYYKTHNMHLPSKNRELNQQGDQALMMFELRLAKYLHRMFDIVQCKHRKYANLDEATIFRELEKVIQCQLNMVSTQIVSEQKGEPDFNTMMENASKVTTNIPLVDIVINIDLFTAGFHCRRKVLLIIKELFNHCTSMKKLLLKHGKIILPALMFKYDKQCHIYQNKASIDAPSQSSTRSSQKTPGTNIEAYPYKEGQEYMGEERDEFLAVIVGQLIRLYAKSKSMSQTFCNILYLEHIIKLMSHVQHIIQSDAQKTFDTIFKGYRIFNNPERHDAFVEWIDKNHMVKIIGVDRIEQSSTHEQLNKIFRKMRQTDHYLCIRMNLKLQYEILSIGLKESMMTLVNRSNINISEGEVLEFHSKSPYFKFATYFVEDKQNLKDVMIAIGNLDDDEERIKEELFLLLSFFILTYEHRNSSIKNIIKNNKSNFIDIMNQFSSTTDDEESQQLMAALISKLNNIRTDTKILLQGRQKSETIQKPHIEKL